MCALWQKLGRLRSCTEAISLRNKPVFKAIMTTTDVYGDGVMLASDAVQAKSRVLVIEDEPIMAHATKLLLHKLGYEVCGIGSTAEEALQLESETKPDVILVDIDIPGNVDGIGVVAEIRRRRKVPVVYASARRDEHTLRRIQAEGCMIYLAKPYEPFQLRFALHTALHKCGLQTELAKWEEHSRLLFAKNPFPMWILDVKDLRFLEVNEAALRQYGYSKSEFLRMNSLDIRPPEEVPVFLSHLASASSGTGPAGIWHHRRKDGSRFTVEVTAHNVTWNGRTAQIVSATDITEKEAIEHQFLRSQRVESIGALALGIAHDLNNIFAPILLSAQMLDDADECEKQALRQTIIKSAERGIQMVRQFLSFTKGGDGTREVLNLNEVVADICRVTRETFPKCISFHSVIEPGLWHVLGDPTQLQQMLLNLAVNARDAMPDGGTLTICAQNIEVSQNKQARFGTVNVGPHVLLRVKDTGHGIAENDENKLFNPFFSTKAKGKGTGLGLSIVGGIVRNHRGFLDVNSKPGCGTTFEIYLPAAAIRPAASHAMKEFPNSAI